VPQSSRNNAGRSASRAGASRSRGPGERVHSSGVSVVRTAVCVIVAALGIAWMAVYINVAEGGRQLTWMGDLGRWNFLIGFGLIFLALALAASPATPLGRGRGVVVGMLGCFLLGLIWIVLYYIVGQTSSVPVIRDLGQYNLVVGIGFMAVGFIYATHWE
jgi:hypothetical protein